MTDTHRAAAELPDAARSADPGAVPADERSPRDFLRRPDVAIPGALLAFYLVLWVLVLTRPNFLTDFDGWVRDRVQNVARSPDDGKPHWPLIRHIADLGGSVLIHSVPVRVQLPVAAMGAAAVVASVVRRSFRPLLAAGLGLAELLLVLMLKANGHRPGPGNASMPGGLGYFPSGHTANTVTGYGTCALILAWLFTSRRARVVIATAMTALALAMGFSLVWLDYHWVSDTLGSYALCGAGLFAVAWSLEMGWSGRRRPMTKRHPCATPVSEVSNSHTR